MKKPTITTVITTFNSEAFIEKRLVSIFNQKGSFQMDIYIFDDCSTDNTLGIVENLLRTYPIPQNMNVRIFKNNTNIGRQANYNNWFKFLKTCNTDFACILDGDDWWESPAFIKKHLRYHKIHQTAPASFSMYYLYYEENGTMIVHPQEEELKNKKVKKLTAHIYASGNPTPNMGGGYTSFLPLSGYQII